jgi:hypothetical protein
VSDRFQVNNPRVMHETIEGEVILINLDTGTYYSLRDSAADVWQGIQSGADEDEIVDALAGTYEGSRDEVREAVGELLSQLEQEGLIQRGDGGSGGGRFVLTSDRGERAPFPAPVLEKHIDMQDLILLDPVHEVDARGWPHAEPRDAVP